VRVDSRVLIRNFTVGEVRTPECRLSPSGTKVAAKRIAHMFDYAERRLR